MDEREYANLINRVLFPSKKVLDEALREWRNTGNPREFVDAFSKDENGDLVLHYSERSEYGSLVAKFNPSEAVGKIISECEKIYEKVIEELRASGGEIDLKEQEFVKDEIIETLATLSVHRLLIGLRTKLCEAIEDNLEESLLLAEVVLRGHPKLLLEGEAQKVRAHVDCREIIGDAVKRIAKRKQDHLKGLLGENLPNLTLEPKLGRPLGSKTEKSHERLARENDEHRRQIIEAMRSLYENESNEFLAEDVIKKNAVAEKMGITRATLYTWLENGGFDFELLKEEAIRMSSRN